MIHSEQIGGRASKILKFRNDIKDVENKERRNFIRNRFSQENSSSYSFENSEEYGDNILRNFRLTNFFTEKRYGNYHYINAQLK